MIYVLVIALVLLAVVAYLAASYRDQAVQTTDLLRTTQGQLDTALFNLDTLRDSLPRSEARCADAVRDRDALRQASDSLERALVKARRESEDLLARLAKAEARIASAGDILLGVGGD
jgi:cell division septum initiation protein DivIVA